MTEIGETTQSSRMARIQEFLTSRRGMLRDYFTAISGSAGRLVFSLVYFIALANTLSIADFGLFATASAAGVMLSRILAFGFISAIYRVATIRPNLLGAFTGGFILLGLLSLPVLALAGWVTFALFFAGDVALWIFAVVVFTEALLWRPVELAVIVNNGMGKFGRAAILVIMGTLLRAAAALVFIFWPAHNLAAWSNFYLVANAISLVITFGFFYPRQRLRFRPELYWRRVADSVYVAGAEVLFYLQMEFDKLLVLSIGGPHLAGIYAIIMRLVDLTAIPIRTFTMMLVQKMMRAPEMLARLSIRAGIESGVFAVSTLALGALAILLYIFPRALGGNVSEAAPLVGLALLVPAFRNLVEYQAELLFARGQSLIRAINLALLAGLKGVLLWWALIRLTDTVDMVMSLNAVFAALYLASALLTYSMLRRPAKTL
jgi:O-antigen/teichoic acid export membrane protein